MHKFLLSITNRRVYVFIHASFPVMFSGKNMDVQVLTHRFLCMYEKKGPYFRFGQLWKYLQKKVEVMEGRYRDLLVLPKCKSAAVASWCRTKEIWAEEEEAALSSLLPPPLTCYANRLSSCPLAAHCTVASTDLLSARCPTQARDTVYWKRFCLYLVPLSFRRLKAWPPCCLTHHSLPPPCPPSPPPLSGSQGTPTL